MCVLTSAAIADHTSQKPRAEIACGVDGVSCLHTERHADTENGEENSEWNETSWWWPITLVGERAHNDEQNGCAEELANDEISCY